MADLMPEEEHEVRRLIDHLRSLSDKGWRSRSDVAGLALLALRRYLKEPSNNAGKVARTLAVAIQHLDTAWRWLTVDQPYGDD